MMKFRHIQYFLLALILLFTGCDKTDPNDPVDIPAGIVARRTDEAEVVLPTHGGDHVLGRKIQRSVVVPGADQYQRRDREKLVPNRDARIEFDDITAR